MTIAEVMSIIPEQKTIAVHMTDKEEHIKNATGITTIYSVLTVF